MHRLQLPALEFGQSPAPLSIATGLDADGWCSGAVGSSTALEAAWGLVVDAQTLSGVDGGRKTWRVYAQEENSALFVCVCGCCIERH